MSEPEKNTRRSPGRNPLVWIIVLVLILLFIQMAPKTLTSDVASVETWEIDEYIRKGWVDKMVLTDETITVTLAEGAKLRDGHSKLQAKINKDEDLKAYKEQARKYNVKYNYAPESKWLSTALYWLAPSIIFFILIYFLFIRQMRQVGGGGVLSFGKSRAKLTSKEHTNVTFEDVAGIDEAKDECREIIEFLRNPDKFQRLGGRMPRGVLLVGPPGTG
ncbi:MAG TPA: ATP-dependent metallopeptidase FtsH/Yme1/Tma family protein, partial [Planctomycetota bacterium]|nr:ATP-dependent metallopeptidase FtsH/Yme1/Tma family protein [Planctomycetota bacterium]